MSVLPFPKHPAVEQSDQACEAIARLDDDHSDAPRWRWDDLYDLTGPMLPGDLTIVGASSGNGKTALMLSQLDWLASEGYAVLYAPLELDPERMRRMWACWDCGYPWEVVARGGWSELPPNAKERCRDALKAHCAKTSVFFAPERRLGLDGLRAWLERTVQSLGQQHIGAVVIDHFHRMSHGTDGASFRLTVTEAARSLKDLAREYAVPLIVTAQLNRAGASAVVDRYFPPTLDRLKETSALGEEADVVIMLSRRLSQTLDTETLKLVQSGHKSIRDFEDFGIMQVTIRKHRLKDSCRDRTALLRVRDGRVVPLDSKYSTPYR